jgi:hypothetical protein
VLKTLPLINSDDIFKITAKVLKRYDATALIKYLATKERMQRSSEVKKALNSR